MKINVVSDTHMPKKSKTLPTRLIHELSDADMIIHAGDWQTLDLYNELKSYAPLVGVVGNVDGEEIQEILPEKQIVEVCGKRIGITHGHGKGKTTEKRAVNQFEGEKVDCIIFGHSHIPINKLENNLLLFNPGSPTDKRRQEMYSFGILMISETIESEHIFFN